MHAERALEPEEHHDSPKKVFKIVVAMLIGISLFACLHWFVVSRAAVFSPTNQVASAALTGMTEVRIEGFAFAPGNLTIQAGTSVRWENFDAVSQTVTSVEPAGILASGPLGKDDSSQYRFVTPGVYTYHCNFHPPIITR